MGRAAAAGILLLRFLWQVLLSGVSTARIMLRPGPMPPAGLIRMGFAPMSENSIAFLGCLVTLTPGTTVINIDMVQHEMLLHLLDLSQAEATVASIREEFECYVILLFNQPKDES